MYIIRSDLGCYMKCNSYLDDPIGGKHGQEFEIYPLDPSCAFGDHYLYGPDGFYIIKNNQFIIVNDLNAPTAIPMVS